MIETVTQAKLMKIPEDADQALIDAINKANTEIQAVHDRLDADRQAKLAAQEEKRKKAEDEEADNRFKLADAELVLSIWEGDKAKLELEITAKKTQIAALKKALGIKATRAKRKPKEPSILEQAEAGYPGQPGTIAPAPNFEEPEYLNLEHPTDGQEQTIINTDPNNSDLFDL